MQRSATWDFGNNLAYSSKVYLYLALDFIYFLFLTVALDINYSLDNLDSDYNLDIVYDLEKIYGFLSCWLCGASWGFNEGFLHPSLQQPTARLQGVASAHCPL